MRKFRFSELLFLGLGLLLIAVSFELVVKDLSLAKVFNLRANPGDPFEASYYLKDESASNTVAEAIPTPKPKAVKELGSAEMDAPAIYLLSPANQALLSIDPQDPKKEPSLLKFEFEVFPRTSAVHFELKSKTGIVQMKDLEASTDGKHTIRLVRPGPGLYQWQVKTVEKTSELRELTIKGIHS